MIVPRPNYDLSLGPDRVLRVGVGGDRAGTLGMSCTGAVLWEASTVLSALLREHSDEVSGKKVLELGAGVAGLPGQTAACVGAAEVRLTDTTNVLEQLKTNVERNRAQHGCVVHAAELTWASGRPIPPSLIAFAPDLLLLADAVYDDGEPQALAELVVSFFDLNPHAEAWLVNCRTRACARLRPWLRKQRLEVETLGQQTPSMFGWRIRRPRA